MSGLISRTWTDLGVVSREPRFLTHEVVSINDRVICRSCIRDGNGRLIGSTEMLAATDHSLCDGDAMLWLPCSAAHGL